MGFNTEIIKFRSDGNTLVGNLYLPEIKPDTSGILILHGGGKSSKDRFIHLQEFLATNGVASFAFNFRGVGDSEGKFEEGTLSNRLTDSLAAFSEFSEYISKDHIFVMGNSMGGHVAARLVEKEPSVPGVLLLYAAAYGQDAENRLLNDEFTQEIRKEKNWRNSPAFTALKTFNGKLLIAYGEHESVIPQEVQNTYKGFTGEKDKFLILENASHLLLFPKKPEEEKAKQLLYKAILEFIDYQP